MGLVLDGIADEMGKQIASYGHERFSVNRTAPVNALLARFQSSAPRTDPSNCHEPETWVRSYLQELERAAQELLSSHSWYYWLMLARRIPPELCAYPVVRPETIKIVRINLTQLIYKYGLRSFHDVDHDEKTLVARPRAISADDVLAICQIDFIACEMALTVAAIRRLHKGGSLHIPQAGHWCVVLPKATEEMVNLFDNRVAVYGTSLSQFGLPDQKPTNPEDFFRPSTWTPGSLKMLALSANLDRVVVEVPSSDQPVHIIPNFIPHFVRMEGTLQLLDWFADEFRTTTGFEPNKVISFFDALTRHLLRRLIAEPQYWPQLFIRGYWVVGREARDWLLDRLTEGYVESQAQHFSIKTDQRAACRTVADLLRFFTFDSDDVRDMSPAWISKSRKFVMGAEDKLVLDLTLPHRVLWNLPCYIEERGGTIGQERGTKAEQAIFDHIVRRVKKAQVYWNRAYRPKTKSGAPLDEVDGAFERDGVLFVLEIKAFRLPEHYWLEERDVVARRWQRLHEELITHDRTCQKIAQCAIGLDDIKRIVPILCTPYPEYVPTRTDDTNRALFLTQKIPRLCTPDELSDFLNRLNPSNELPPGVAIPVSASR